MAPSASLIFTVRRQKPELITPAKPTPHEFKPLSDIEDHEGLRFHIPIMLFFRPDPSMVGIDPVQVIRDALAETLVIYYPFAGRIREGNSRKLVVDCTGEGVLFIEADADVSLDQFGEELQPPFPSLEELLYDVPSSSGIIDCPLLLIQVTRLVCGGFIFALRFNHTMSDGAGIGQFMKAMGEIARGATSLSVPPVWQRELLSARDPPRATCRHPEFEEVPDPKNGTIVSSDPMVLQSFFFGPDEMSTLCNLLPPRLRNCTKFELLTACLWRCRTIALSYHPSEEVRVLCIVNARRIFNPPLPVGYYGNAFAIPVAISTAGELSQSPLEHAIELVVKTKLVVTEEYVKSFADLMVIKGRPQFTVERTFVVSDLKHAGFRDVDFGWGRPVFAGPFNATPEIASFYIPYENKKGENGILVAIYLPTPAMERFKRELQSILNKDALLGTHGKCFTFIRSTL